MQSYLYGLLLFGTGFLEQEQSTKPIWNPSILNKWLEKNPIEKYFSTQANRCI